MTTTHLHYFACPETDHGDYAGKHADRTPFGAHEAQFLEGVAVRYPKHPVATYVGRHRKATA